MREILDRYAERLTREERLAIWEEVSGSRPMKSLAMGSRARLNWTLTATAATAAVTLFVLVLPQREGPWVGIERGVQPLASDRQAPIGREEPRRTAAAPGTEHEVEPAPMPTASIARAAIVTEIPEPRSTPTTPSPANTGSTDAVTGRIAPSRANTVSTGAVTGRIIDSQNRPVPGASVTVKEAGAGALSGEDGTYRIDRLPPATYSLQVHALGYQREIRTGISIGGDETATTDIQMKEAVVAKMDEIIVMSEKRIDTQSSSTKQSISGEKLTELPVESLSEAVATKAGVVAKGDAQHFRGGRPGEAKIQLDEATFGLALPPVIPTTGGTRLPNDEAYDSMFFKSSGVNPFIATDEDPLSTFAVDVDAASYTVTRRYIELGHLPPADAVRVEEFVNFFPQGYPRFESEDFRILIDGAPSPFGRGYHLLRIGLKGREITERDRKPAQLTFVIDVSGSMARENRLELVKRALRLLVDELRGKDRVGVVVYGTEGRVLLEPVAVEALAASAIGVGHDSDDREEEGSGVWGARQRIVEVIERLRPEGSTNAEHGLRLGYEMARRGYRPEAINRIVLCSDGVANVGRTGPESILAQVRTEADRGIHLTTIGFGMGNYNDVLMEQLADRGDGNHYYVDDIDEARRVFVENLTGTLQTIAKDAKVQVEFDATRVLRYRLLGFENRDIADSDFRNDKVDAGEIGAGHEVTALYEVKLAPKTTKGALATVRIRYAQPEQEGAGGPNVREIEQRFDAAALSRRPEDAAPRFRLDAAVAEFAEILRGSYWAREGRLSDVLSVARSAARSLRDDTTAGFVTLVEKAAELSGRSKPGAREEER